MTLSSESSYKQIPLQLGFLVPIFLLIPDLFLFTLFLIVTAFIIFPCYMSLFVLCYKQVHFHLINVFVWLKGTVG